MQYKISDKGIRLICSFEGLELKAYLCPAGVWTIGIGHTKNVKKGDVITKEQAIQYFKDDVRPIEDYLNKLDICETQGQFDALVSFIFNLGVGNFKSSTLLKKIKNKASDEEICAQFRRWVYAGGKKLNGLVRRREAECSLWIS